MNIIGWNINDEDARKGMLSSILLHLILLLICLMPFVFTTSKNQETQQIIVTFSDLNDDTPSASAAASSAVSEDVAEETSEEPKEPESKPKTTTNHVAQEKTETTPVQQKKKPKEVINHNTSPEQETSPVKVEETSAQEREEALKKAKAEEAMRRETERRAKEEAEKKHKENELAKKKSSFGSLFNNTDSANSKEESDGEGEDILAYIQPTHTIGGGLGNRNVLFEPTVTDSSRKVGRVVISICVNRAGQVSSANFTQKGSTTSDAQLVKLAKQAALQYRFNTSDLSEQCGSVTFEFKLK